MHLNIEKCPHSPILSAGLSFFNLSGKPNTKRQQLLVSDWCHEEPDGSHEESIASLVVNTQCSTSVARSYVIIAQGWTLCCVLKNLLWIWKPQDTVGEYCLLKQFSLNHLVEHLQTPKLAELHVSVETSTIYFIIHNQFVK